VYMRINIFTIYTLLSTAFAFLILSTISFSVYAATFEYIDGDDAQVVSGKLRDNGKDYHIRTTGGSQVVSFGTPAFKGAKSVKFRIPPNSAGSYKSQKTEVRASRVLYKHGIDRYLGYALLLPSNAFGTPSKWTILSQWQQPGEPSCASGSRPILVFQMSSGDRSKINVLARKLGSGCSYTVMNLGSIPVEYDTWMNIVTHANFNAGGGGKVRIWKNGKKIIDWTGAIGYPGNDGTQAKIGIYRGNQSQEHVAYFDEIRFGDNYASVDPGGGGQTVTPNTQNTNPPFTQTGPCSLYPSGIASFSPYGLNWDWTSAQRELLLKATCEADRTDIALGNGREAGTGATKAGLTYVYHQGYWNDGSAWNQTPYSAQCSGTDKTKVAGVWCKGSATASIPPSAKWFVGYTCIWSGTKWECGCTDTQCSSKYWQVQGVKR
jgi:hypothetical protein